MGTFRGILIQATALAAIGLVAVEYFDLRQSAPSNDTAVESAAPAPDTSPASQADPIPLANPVDDEIEAPPPQLSIDEEVEILLDMLGHAAAENDHVTVLDYIDEMRSLDASLPDGLMFLEGRALLATGELSVGMDRLEQYVDTAGRRGDFYHEAVQLMAEAEDSTAREKTAIEIDRLSAALLVRLENGDHTGALAVVDDIRALDADPPARVVYQEALLYVLTGANDTAKSVLSQHLTSADPGALYTGKAEALLAAIAEAETLPATPAVVIVPPAPKVSEWSRGNDLGDEAIRFWLQTTTRGACRDVALRFQNPQSHNVDLEYRDIRFHCSEGDTENGGTMNVNLRAGQTIEKTFTGVCCNKGFPNNVTAIGNSERGNAYPGYDAN